MTQYTKEWVDGYYNKTKVIYFAYTDNKGDEIKHGPETFFLDGELVVKSTNREGKRDGVYLSYSSGRNTEESHWKEGQMQMPYKRMNWFPDGTKSDEYERQENGVTTKKYWNRRGILLTEGIFHLDGSWKEWNGTFLRQGKGDQMWIDDYKDGNKVSEKESSLD